MIDDVCVYSGLAASHRVIPATQGILAVSDKVCCRRYAVTRIFVLSMLDCVKVRECVFVHVCEGVCACVDWRCRVYVYRVRVCVCACAEDGHVCVDWR
jgi:hypothetical protein